MPREPHGVAPANEICEGKHHPENARGGGTCGERGAFGQRKLSWAHGESRKEPTCACGRLLAIVFALLFTMKIATQACEPSRRVTVEDKVAPFDDLVAEMIYSHPTCGKENMSRLSSR